MIFRPFMFIQAQIVPYKPFPRWMKNRHRYLRSRFRYLGQRSLARVFPGFGRQGHQRRTSEKL